MKIFTVIFSIFLTACGMVALPTTSTSDATMPSTPVGTVTTTAVDSYIIQPGDVLFIDVWKEKDLQREVMIRPDGGLNFPLAGDVAASGKTIEQLQKELAEKLTKYVPGPVVSIAIKASSGNKIYVVGKVNRPGEFVAIRNMDVMQALSMAGGLTPYAAENKIKIIRRENGVQRSIPFKYSHVKKGEDLDQNIILQGGDVVVVP